MRETIVLAIDPGLVRTGFCALGERTCAISTYHRPKGQGETARLLALYDAAQEWVGEYKPSLVLIEEQRGMRARGAVQEKVYAALCMGAVRVAAWLDLEPAARVLCISPSTVKKHVAGSGLAPTPEVVAEIRRRWQAGCPDLGWHGEDAVMAYGMARIGLEVAVANATMKVREIC